MTKNTPKTVGCDLGDKYSHVCVLDGSGNVEVTTRLTTSRAGFRKWFVTITPCTVVVEVGTHSRWVKNLLQELGHKVIVANARQVRLIYHDKRKNDRLDAEKLARLARVDPHLLSPIHHRDEQSQSQLGVLRARDQLVKARTELINHVRGVSKSFGIRIRKCDSPTFARRARETAMSKSLLEALEPLLRSVDALSEQIKAYETMLAQMVERCPDVQPLLAIHGVGELTAMAYIRTLEDPDRFPRSRDVGAFLGLVPKERQTGNTNPELRISKAGDPFVRRLLVNCAQRMLGPFGQDSDLRRYGLRLMGRGGKTAKKKAVIAVARKLAVLMHRLWLTGEVYEPLRQGAQAAA